MRVAVEAGRELAEKIRVDVPVEVMESRAFGTLDRERKRAEIDDRARVAARHMLGRRDVTRMATWMRRRVALLGCRQCVFDRSIGVCHCSFPSRPRIGFKQAPRQEL